MSTIQDFTLVFKENRWGNAESASGAGSALSSQPVLDSVRALDELIRRLTIHSINDAPCGDFNWIPLILGRFPQVEYRGFDIVPDLIELNRQKFPAYRFEVLDVTEDTLPHGDLIFCKDLFLHLSNLEIARALKNFKISGCRFMLATSIVGAENQELIPEEPGACRHVDLTRAPFNLPEPMWSTHYLSLWSLDAIAMAVFDEMPA